MAQLFSHFCDRCQTSQSHVKFEVGKEIAYVCCNCRAVSGPTVNDLLSKAKKVEVHDGNGSPSS